MKKPPSPPLRAVFLDLQEAHVGKGYDRLDRHNDFVAVFFGTPNRDQQERVLYQILYECHLNQRVLAISKQSDSVDTHMMMLVEGKRHFALWLLDILTKTPRKTELITETVRSEE